MATLIVSPEARDDISTIADHLREVAGPLVADKYLAEFDRVAELLTMFPGIGAPRPKLGPDARTTVVAPYVLIYDHRKPVDTVVLLRVVHGRRNITIDLIARR